MRQNSVGKEERGGQALSPPAPHAQTVSICVRILFNQSVSQCDSCFNTC